MIKQIQLRGISRSPSDRMSEDGGCAESLNVYIEGAENAPVIVPDDVTESLGLPDSLQADRIFIHKTASYENIIVVSGSEVIAYANGSEQTILSLSEGETISDLESVGNTIIISTSLQMHYILFQEGEYQPLGNTIPKVYMGFVNVDQAVYKQDVTEAGEDAPGNLPWKIKTAELSTSNLASLGSEGDDYGVTDEEGLKVLTAVWGIYQEMIGHNLNLGVFNAPVMIRYAVKLYDNTYLEASSPIMLGGAFNDGELQDAPVKVLWNMESSDLQDSTYYNHKLKVSLCYPYKIGVYKAISGIVLDNWKDLIQSIDVYITPAIEMFPNGSIAATYNTQDADSEGYNRQIILDPANSLDADNIEKNILSNGVFFKVKSFTLEELEASSPTDIMTLNGDMRGENITTNTRFSELAVSSEIIAHGMDSYNNSIISHGATVALTRGLPVLNGQCGHSSVDGSYGYAFRYHIPSWQENDFVVYSKNIIDTTQQEVLRSDVGEYVYLTSGRLLRGRKLCAPFAFLSYPDARCNKVDICKVDENGVEIGVCTLEMKPHPTVANCSYAWLGFNKSLESLEYQESTTAFVDSVAENRLERIDNKLFVSTIDNPFSFPIANRFTFQSAVINTAVATTALSQGQFGQFPLYVFTEDGIWVMETASDGSFVTSKPVSRDVCINPESITSIDNAVIFVTERGVMMIQGSQVTNLSPFMNGKHYSIEETPASMIEQMEGFMEFVDTLKDTTPFMTFIKEASVAYDYTGKRLVFINKNEDYQYCFHLDTSTWHKMQNEGAHLIAPINSYPECLVQGRNERAVAHLNVTTNQAQISREESIDIINAFLSEKGYETFEEETLSLFLEGEEFINVDHWDEVTIDEFIEMLDVYHILVIKSNVVMEDTAIFDLSTTLDVALESQTAQKGVIITRPIDFGYADVRKAIRDVRIRGQYKQGAVKFMLLGSDDGQTYRYINTLRGKSWKLFRIIILADLAPEERISWIDVDFETRFQNRLR